MLWNSTAGFSVSLGEGRKRVLESSRIHASTANWLVSHRDSNQSASVASAPQPKPRPLQPQQRYAQPPAFACGAVSPHPGYRSPSPPGSYKASSLARPSLPGLPIFHVYGETLRAEDEAASRRHDHRGLPDFPRLPQWLLRRREEEGPQSNR